MRKKGNTSETIKCLTEAIKLDPRQGLFRFMLGRVYCETSQHDKAIPHLTEAVALNPNDNEGQSWLARARSEKANLDMALVKKVIQK